MLNKTMFNVLYYEFYKYHFSLFSRNGDVIKHVEADLNLADKDYKKTLKLTWLTETQEAPFIPCVCVYFDHIISKPVLGKDEDFKAYIGKNTKVNSLFLFVSVVLDEPIIIVIHKQ